MESTRDSFIPSTIKMWNSLNNTIRNVDTLSEFTSELKKIAHIDKRGQIQFLLEINHNLKTKLNFLARLKKYSISEDHKHNA
jgi:hypothetical protein